MMSIRIWLLVMFFISLEVTGEWDELKIVMEGGVVTLQTRDTALESLREATWLLERGGRAVRIAQMYQGFNPFYEEGPIGRMKVDPETGGLTIWNISTGDSGLYAVSLHTPSIHKRSFKVDVYGPVSAPVITSLVRVNQSQGTAMQPQKTEEICLVSCSVRNDRDVFISWYKGSEIMNQTSSPDLSINLSLSLELHYNDPETFICTAANPVSNKSVRLHRKEICQQREGCLDHCSGTVAQQCLFQQNYSNNGYIKIKTKTHLPLQCELRISKGGKSNDFMPYEQTKTAYRYQVPSTAIFSTLRTGWSIKEKQIHNDPFQVAPRNLSLGT